MQQIEATTATSMERKRVESVVETLAALRSGGESAAEIAHDARNMVTALGLYCDLLDEPGVLTPAFAHYAGELRLVAAASRRLVEKLVALDSQAAPMPALWRGDGPTAARWPARPSSGGQRAISQLWEPMPSLPVANLASELQATWNLLTALSGPSIALTMDIEGGALPARIAGEDLTRLLVNLVKNAVEAMPSGGSIRIVLREQMLHQPKERHETGREAAIDPTRWLVLGVEDSGPGIAPDAQEKIFETGYTGHGKPAVRPGLGSASHQGLGLSICRSIVEAAGGRIYAENRTPGGARLVVELPVAES